VQLLFKQMLYNGSALAYNVRDGKGGYFAKQKGIIIADSGQEGKDG